MRSITITFDDTDFARLSDEAARRGTPVADLVGELAREALARREEVIREAQAVLAELRARPSEFSEEEAMRIAIEEVRAMRAERRAADPL